MKKIGVGVVGLGVGEQHARAYLRSGFCDLKWLCDVDAGRARDLQATLGAGRATSSYEDMLADPSVDVISIASFDDAHFEQVVAALKAGKHIFVEKPLCRTREEVNTIHREWMQAGGARRGLSSNLVLRAAPLYRRLHRAIRDDVLGHIYAIDGEYLYGRLHKITEGWRAQVENYSVMQGGGVHMIDLVHWMLGQRPQWVSADGNRICTEGTAFRYLDYVTASAGYADGCLARFTANFGCVHRHQHVLRVYGTKGTFIYDDAGARFHASRDPAQLPETWTEKPLPETKGDLIPAFVQGLIEGKDWSEEVKAILDDISVCVACDQALIRGEKVKVEYT